MIKMVNNDEKIIEKEELATKETKKGKDGVKEFIHTFVIAAILALAIRSFLYEPFHIPSSSMKPNLLIGDYIFVSKLSYGYSKYSFPLNAFDSFEGRIFFSQPKRGDVAVFRLPSDPKTNYIKRIVGLPGDKISVQNGILFINDEKIEKISLGDFTEEGYEDIPVFSENIGGKKFKVLDEIQDNIRDNTGNYYVPKGHYFAMGDNRDNSLDSRFQMQVGFIPEENLIGRATIIFFSTKEPVWKIFKLPFSIRYSRIGHSINRSL